MPCILKVHIEGGRALPLHEKSASLPNAYVEVRFADHPNQRTQTSNRTQNPVWREDFRFEIPEDALLQDEPLELKVRAIIVGLVDEVITEIDPDYHWSDSFRSSRSSNEASQRTMNQMSCRIRREMGRKALEMGGNAILGYNQWIDIEPYSQTITLRSLGTAVILEELNDETSSSSSSFESSPDDSVASSSVLSLLKDEPYPLMMASKGIEIATLGTVPAGSIVAMGGIVAAKSVKMMSEESEYGSSLTRDRWLTELREEIHSHARSLGCNVVLGYRENVSIHEGLYVLAAEGTACRLPRRGTLTQSMTSSNIGPRRMTSSADENQEEEESLEDLHIVPPRTKTRPNVNKARRRKRKPLKECSPCHLPKRRVRRLNEESYRCNICRKAQVGDLLLSTLALPLDVESFSTTHLVEGYVCRPLRKQRDGEPVAVTVSSNLPFVEYELYRQLQFKLRYLGYNGVFGLRYQIYSNDTYLVAIASGTGICLPSLPQPGPLQISRNIDIRDAEDAQIFSIQKNIATTAAENHQNIEKLYQDRFSGHHLSSSDSSDSSSSSSSSSTSSSSSSSSSSSNDEVVQIDDEADEDLLLTLVEPKKDSAILAGTLDSQPLMDASLSPKSSLQLLSHFICHFRRFIIEPGDHHPSSALSSQFSLHYEEIMEQVSQLGFAERPQIHAIKHQLNILRKVEVQIVTTVTVFGYVNTPVAASKDLLPKNVKQYYTEGKNWETEEDVFYDPLPSNHQNVNEEDTPEGDSDVEDPFVPLVLTTGTLIPRSVFSRRCGTINVLLFKEIYYTQCPSGFVGFVNSTISDIYSIAHSLTRAMGGNALVSIEFKPAAFYENFKSQLHAVVALTADVILVEHDRPSLFHLHRHLYE